MRPELAAVGVIGVALVLTVASSVDIQDTAASTTDASQDGWRSQVENAAVHNATFAGGCFWCIEAVYENGVGVASAVSGYAGGRASTATYKQVSTGTTDHREAVRVQYYPSVVSYEELLEAYWRSIDPTDPGGQFADRGPQYTTAIYAHSLQQYRAAKRSKRELANSGRFDEPIVTTIVNATTFFRAEDRHQNYSRRNTVRYEAYEKASGREGFIERVWGD